MFQLYYWLEESGLLKWISSPALRLSISTISKTFDWVNRDDGPDTDIARSSRL